MAETKWENYEEIAIELLNRFARDFGIDSFEGKQKIRGNKSKTEWEIDGIGFLNKGDIFLIVECRRYTSTKQNQEKVGALAYRIHDTGASGGILVSPLGLQFGAELIARAENITSVKLRPESTTKKYMMSFLDKVKIGTADKAGIHITERARITIIQDS